MRDSVLGLERLSNRSCVVFRSSSFPDAPARVVTKAASTSETPEATRAPEMALLVSSDQSIFAALSISCVIPSTKDSIASSEVMAPW